VQYELSLEIQFVILVVFKSLLDLEEFYMSLSYFKVSLKSGNAEELLSSSFCSLVGSLIRPSLSRILLEEHFLLPKPLLIRKR